MRTPITTRKRLVFNRTEETATTGLPANDTEAAPAEEAAADKDSVDETPASESVVEEVEAQTAEERENEPVVAAEAAAHKTADDEPEAELISAEVETEPPTGYEVMEEGGVVL